MRAIGVTAYGGPDALHELDVEREPLGAGQVRVRVTAAAVNPTDTGVRSGARAGGAEAASPPGDVPGMDIAGTVTEVGEGVDLPYAVGDRVMGIVVPSGAHGAYREDIVLPARSVTRVPSGTSDAEAATLPMNGLTARRALDLLELSPGQTVAVTGAAGAFGGYVVQLAKTDGLTVIADASEADEALVRRLGADVVVRRGDGVADRIREHAPDGVDGLADGSVQGPDILAAVRDGGGVATVRGWDGGGEKRVSVRPVWVRQAAEDWDQLDRLREQVEDGSVTLRLADTMPAGEARNAHERLEAGGVRGRLVLIFD